MSIAENIKKIKLEMQEACHRANRETHSCHLIAVSKTKPTSKILEAIDAQQFDFGENYVQESLAKIAEIKAIGHHPRWHFIGSLQSNKVHQVVGNFSLIHSVDRLSLARAISKEAVKKNITQDILMQINVGDEDSKSGVHLNEASDLFLQILSLKNLRLCGLMALPPLTEELGQQRSYFRILNVFMGDHLHELSDSQKAEFKILSMGTTHDFSSAILEGATHIRVGTAIFGARE